MVNSSFPGIIDRLGYSCYFPDRCGGLAQLVERLPYTQDVVGSSPAVPIYCLKPGFCRVFLFRSEKTPSLPKGACKQEKTMPPLGPVTTMIRSVKYVLTYKKLDERISLDQFDSASDAMNYCQREQIEDPIEICRVERIEERVLGRSQIMKLLGKPE